MRQTRTIRTVQTFLLLGLCLALVAVSLAWPGDPEVVAQPPEKQQLAAGLQYVPTDAALFVYVDVSKFWQNPILQSIRKEDAKLFADFTSRMNAEVGLSPDDIKSMVIFFPKIKRPVDSTNAGVVLTFAKAYDEKKLAKGLDKLLPPDAATKLVELDERTAMILVNLDAEYAKPRKSGEDGPLSAALKEAPKHAAFIGANLANLPDEIRADDLPNQLKPLQALLRAQTITGSIDLGKNIDIDVRVKTATATQASECEKALGLVLTMLQAGIETAMKELDPDMKEMGLKDVFTLMKAGISAAKTAKISALGTEVKLTASIPTDLPFANAFVVAKKKVQEAAAQAQSINNLKQIALAMHSYHDTYGEFPPAAVCDKKGNPQLSWRVLILPFLEGGDLYKEFKLDEPWDSANNKKLLAKMPKVYAMPGKTKEGDTDTYYRVFVSKGAGFDWITGTKITAITDGTSNTIMCVTAASPVPWTKPEELDFDPNKDMTKLVGQLLNGRIQAAMFDGSVRTFTKMPDKMTLNALITRSGGEIIPDIE